GTFHSICARILRREIDILGYDKNFVIYDKGDQLSMIRGCIKTLDLDNKKYSPNIISSIIDKAKNNLEDVEIFEYNALNYYKKIVAKVYTQYQEELFENNALDFNDLILLTVKLFKENPEILENYQNKFRYILVDEYQDINFAQYQLVKLLSEKYNNLFVVGDPDQSIYKFRGADLNNILRFEQDFPHSKVIKLEQNYRSTKVILEGASNLIKHNKNLKEKADIEKGEEIPSLDNRRENIVVVVGDKIRHVDWGIGTILSKIDTENDIFITVDFERVGLKKLSVNFAPLEK
ncbi:unnamed protein product, partial [marine sediment metagenome]